MVDPIGIKAGTVVDRLPAPTAGVQAAAEAQSVKPAPSEPQAQQAATASLTSRALAASAPVDAERVARIRKAVQEGRFPLIPSTIADRLLALKLEWNPNEQA